MKLSAVRSGWVAEECTRVVQVERFGADVELAEVAVGRGAGGCSAVVQAAVGQWQSAGAHTTRAQTAAE